MEMYAGQSDQNEIVIFNPDETIRRIGREINVFHFGTSSDRVI